MQSINLVFGEEGRKKTYKMGKAQLKIPERGALKRKMVGFSLWCNGESVLSPVSFPLDFSQKAGILILTAVPPMEYDRKKGGIGHGGSGIYAGGAETGS